MTYNFRVGLRARWQLELAGEDVPLQDMLALLAAIEATGHIAGACRQCGMSYRHAWGLLRRFERDFGTALLVTRRRQGTVLSPFAQRLLWADRRIEARLAPTLDSLASELQEELERLLPEPARHLRLHASHGFAVEALLRHMDARGEAMELRYRTAGEALASLVRGECDLAGFQVPLGEFEPDIMAHYAQWLDPAEHLLIHLATRNTGFFVRAGNPKRILGMRDLQRPDVRFVNRQAGSSTRQLIALMLRRHGVPVESVQGYDSSEFTHMAVAAHIASGMADVGVGVETAASRFGLDFVPLVRERYFFAVRRGASETQAVKGLLEVMRSPAFLDYLAELPGYDPADTGRVQTLSEAFPPRRTTT